MLLDVKIILHCELMTDFKPFLKKCDFLKSLPFHLINNVNDGILVVGFN